MLLHRSFLTARAALAARRGGLAALRYSSSSHNPRTPLAVEANVFLSGVGAGSDLSGFIKLAASREITCAPPSIYGGVAVKGEWDVVMSALKEYHAAALGDSGSVGESGDGEIHMTLNLRVTVGSVSPVPRNLVDTDKTAPKKTVVLPPAARKRLLAEQAEAAVAAVAATAEEDDIEVSSLSEAENAIEVSVFGKGGAADSQAEDEFHRLLEGLGGLRSGAKRPPGMPARRPRGDPMPSPRGMSATDSGSNRSRGQ
jgi:hypothetical protein